MNEKTQKVIDAIAELSGMELDKLVEAINEIKKELHAVSPFKDEPVDVVLWVKAEDVYANDYNPNQVAPPEMKLLETSILEDGYTQPIVTFFEEDQYTVVDGFHRNRVGKECMEVNNRIKGYLPVVPINKDREDRNDRIASTIRHNRARGKHQVEQMANIVLELKRRNWNDKKIARELGMDPDEILRLSQVGGLADMFADYEFSMAWEAELPDLLNNEIELIDESA